MNKYVIENKNHGHLCSKFAYVSKDKILLWSACDAHDVRIFDSKKEAVSFLDKKWMKYGAKVNVWQPVEITSAKNFKKYFVTGNILDLLFTGKST